MKIADVRITGLTGGTVEGAQAIAAHESPRTTKLYDRTREEVAGRAGENRNLNGSFRTSLLL